MDPVTIITLIGTLASEAPELFQEGEALEQAIVGLFKGGSAPTQQQVSDLLAQVNALTLPPIT